MIHLHDLMVWLQPYFLALAGTIVTSLISVISVKINQFLGLKIDQSNWDIVHSAAMVAAGRVWAHADASISTMEIHSTNPFIVEAANQAIASIPLIAAKTGITPEGLAGLIVAKLGEMQASATKTPVVTKP